MALQEEFEKQGIFLFTYRSILPILIVVLGVLVFVYRQFFDVNPMIPFVYVEILTMIMCLIGLIIRVFTVAYTPAFTSGRNTASQIADELNTTGIYSLVRHPLYLGNFFMWFGVAILTMDLWFICSFTLFYCIYYERIMYAEEQFLRRKFGAVYLDWAEKTPAFIMRLNGYIKPSLSFSWKKTIKKEKNGLFAIFVLLFIFDTLSNSIKARQVMVEFNWITILLIITGILYLIFRHLKWNTRLLDEEGR